MNKRFEDISDEKIRFQEEKEGSPMNGCRFSIWITKYKPAYSKKYWHRFSEGKSLNKEEKILYIEWQMWSKNPEFHKMMFEDTGTENA